MRAKRVELAFSRRKALLRNAAERTVSMPGRTVGAFSQVPPLPIARISCYMLVMVPRQRNPLMWTAPLRTARHGRRLIAARTVPICGGGPASR